MRGSWAMVRGKCHAVLVWLYGTHEFVGEDSVVLVTMALQHLWHCPAWLEIDI